MKVLQVNCVYKKGSTGKIVADIHNVLIDKCIDSVVCYGRQRGNVMYEQNVYKFCSELEGDLTHAAHRYLGTLQYGGCFISTRNLISIIKKEKPDVVHIHCINGYCVNIYKLFSWLGKSKIKTIVTNHAEFFYTGSCGHAYDCNKWQNEPGCGECPILKQATDSRFVDNTALAWNSMKDAFESFDKENLIFTAVSPWAKNRIKLSNIANKFTCVVVENGLETDIFFRKTQIECIDIKERIGVAKNSKMVFHATASFTLSETSIKGGRFIYELAKLMPDVSFVVAALSYQQINELPDNLYLIGSAKNQEELATLYSAADVTIIASKRETFSMVTAESLCCGTPVVGFKAGGPESIALTEYSDFVEYNDIENLKVSLHNMLMNEYDRHLIAEVAKKRYSKMRMVTDYLNIYNKLINQ